MNITSTHTVGIIGGDGKTGSQFRKLFKEQGFSVRSTGLNTRSKNHTLITDCDIIIFALPLSQASELMRSELRSATRKDQLLLDVSSLKKREVQAMKTGRGEVIGMHPLFGPSTDPKGEAVILCPGRTSQQTLTSLRTLLKKMGMKTIVMTPVEHDKLMATVQVIPHLKSFLMADVLRTLGIDLKNILSTCTPSYEMEFNVIARFLDDHPDLYMPIIFRNPETVKILQSMHTIIGDYLEIAKSGNLNDAEKKYQASKLYFKPFLKRARKHSEACIETLLSLKH